MQISSPVSSQSSRTAASSSPSPASQPPGSHQSDGHMLTCTDKQDRVQSANVKRET